MDVLVLLARNAGDVVERDTIAGEVWGGRYVSDDPLSKCITELRRVLGDSAREPSYIQTVHKRGYRLIAIVVPSTNNAESSSLKSSSARIAGLAVVVLIAIGIAIFGNDFFQDGREQPDVFEPALHSIAVLPFNDMSTEGDSEAFADGVSEVLIHQLSQVRDLRVIARNSSFTFKGRNTDIREIGRALNVATVLEGSVQKADGKLRISAQLIDAHTGAHIWSKIYDREDAAIFAIQDEIARAVTTEVKSVALANDNDVASFSATANLGAYELYLLGQSKASGLAAADAVTLFEQAIERDPKFALAYAGLADALWQTVQVRDPAFPTKASIERARLAADRALDLGPDLAAGYASQMLLAIHDRDFDSVENWFQLAVSKNPGHAEAYVRYGDALQRSGRLLMDESRLDHAQVVYEQAAVLDPLNARLKQRLASLAHMRGDAEAINQAKTAYRTAMSKSEAAIVLDSLAEISADRGNLDQAIAYLRIASELSARETGTHNLGLAANYLQLQDYENSQYWLDRVPRPLDFYGLLQLAMFYRDSGQLDRFEATINAAADGTGNNHSLSQAEGEMFALSLSGIPLNCERVFELSGRMDLDRARSRFIPYPDMLLSICHLRVGNEEKALEHQQTVSRIVERLEQFEDADAFLLFMIAGAKALEGDRSGALDYLEHSYDRGACFVSIIKKDPFIAVLRDEDRYQSIISEFENNAEGMRRRVFQAKSNNDWYSLVDIELREW